MGKIPNIQKRGVRIDYVDDWVDDVGIMGSKTFPSLFRIEKMDDEHYWVCFYPNGKRSKRYYFMISGKALRCDYTKGG